MRPMTPAVAHTQIGTELIASSVVHIDSGKLSAESMTTVCCACNVSSVAWILYYMAIESRTNRLSMD